MILRISSINLVPKASSNPRHAAVVFSCGITNSSGVTCSSYSDIGVTNKAPRQRFSTFNCCVFFMLDFDSRGLIYSDWREGHHTRLKDSLWKLSRPARRNDPKSLCQSPSGAIGPARTQARRLSRSLTRCVFHRLFEGNVARRRAEDQKTKSSAIECFPKIARVIPSRSFLRSGSASLVPRRLLQNGASL